MIDARALGRRAGAMRQLRRQVPAPEGLALATAGVPAGTEMDLDVRIEAVVEGVLASGSVTVPLSGECARCLDDVAGSLTVGFQELFLYPGEPSPDADPDDDDQPLIVDERLDLEPVLRDAVVLALPLAPLCRPDCAGLCVECGVRLDDAPAHAHASDDPRWAALGRLLSDQDQNPPASRVSMIPSGGNAGRVEEN